MLTAASRGSRGKGAESQFKALSTKLATKKEFMYYRLPDARAGSFQATLADFLVLWRGMTALIEVKEVAHDYRLSYNNFSPGQVGRQRLWEEAGAVGLVLVYHSTSNLWRCSNIESFTDRSIGGSWDLRDITCGNLQEVFECQLNLSYQKWVQSLVCGNS